MELVKYPLLCAHFRKKNLGSTCLSKQTFKMPLLQVTALYIKYIKGTVNNQYK